MIRTSLLACAGFALAVCTAAPSFAQGVPQTVGVARIDPASLATGYRSTKIVGSSVANDSNETIGTIDDVIVSTDGKVPYVVLSVGGFLGLGARLVVVPYADLRFADGRITLPGATRDELRALPEFKYTTR